MKDLNSMHVQELNKTEFQGIKGGSAAEWVGVGIAGGILGGYLGAWGPAIALYNYLKD